MCFSVCVYLYSELYIELEMYSLAASAAFFTTTSPPNLLAPAGEFICCTGIEQKSTHLGLLCEVMIHPESRGYVKIQSRFLSVGIRM